MSIRNLFQVNLLLEVYDEASETYYKSLIQEISDEGIGIGIPMQRNRHLHMPKGSQWFFLLLHKESQQIFTSTVLYEKHDDEHGIPLYVISWPLEVKKFQRREHFRLQCALQVDYWVLDEYPLRTGMKLPGRKDLGKTATTKRDAEQSALKMLAASLGEPREAFTLNISGGGLLLITEKRFNVGTRLLLRVFLRCQSHETPLMLMGRIVWTSPPFKHAPRRYRHALEYEGVSDQLKDEIVRYIFTVTRERRS